MLGYLLRRLLLALVTIWAITVVTFVIIQLPPGDFVDAYVAQSAAMGRRHSGRPTGLTSLSWSST
jgi:peptide/nickel transport system permease protein